MTSLLPLFLSSVLEVKTDIIGVMEVVAASTVSRLLNVFFGWLSDRLRGRQWIAAAGYAISADVRRFYYFASTWEAGAGILWTDRV